MERIQVRPQVRSLPTPPQLIIREQPDHRRHVGRDGTDDRKHTSTEHQAIHRSSMAASPRARDRHLPRRIGLLQIAARSPALAEACAGDPDGSESRKGPGIGPPASSVPST